MQSEFVKNVLIISSGTGVSQLVTLLLTPILTRNYLPVDFGNYAIFFSIFLILNTISTGKYEKVIILAKSEEEVKLVSFLSLLFVFLNVFFSLIILLVFHNQLMGFFEIKKSLFDWFYLVSPLILIVGLNLILVTYLNRRKKYRTISTSRIIKTMVTLVMGISFIYIRKDSVGLIVSEIIGYLISTLFLLPKTKDLWNLQFLNLSSIKQVAKRYRKFPIYNIPTDLLNMSSSQLPVVLLSTYFGGNILGFFSLMKKVLDAPLNLLSTSILEVFRQKAAEDFLKYGNCRTLFLQTGKSLTLLSILPFGLLFFFSPYVFTMYLGNEWRIAGEFAQIFSIYYFFKFISSPLSYMVYLAEKQNVDFYIHIYIFSSSFLILNTPKYFQVTSHEVLTMYMINFSLVYIFYLIFSFRLTIKND